MWFSLLPTSIASSCTASVWESCKTVEQVVVIIIIIVIIIITVIIIMDNLYIALFSGAHRLTALYNVLQHFIRFTNIDIYNYDS